jgi:HSP20 family protein
VDYAPGGGDDHDRPPVEGTTLNLAAVVNEDRGTTLAQSEVRRCAMFTNTEMARIEPRAFMRRVFRDFDRLFEGGDWLGTRLGKPFTGAAWMPPVEAFERDHHLTVRVELPGMKKEEIGITFTDGVLTIEGERKIEEEEKKNEWYRNERTYGKFVRAIPLPEGVKVDAINATFEGGVLEITVPLPEAAAAAAPKKVEITGADEKKAVKAA